MNESMIAAEGLADGFLPFLLVLDEIRVAGLTDSISLRPKASQSCWKVVESGNAGALFDGIGGFLDDTEAMVGGRGLEPLTPCV